MKKILLFMLLLVNLQLTTDNGSLDIGLGEISAQTYREEQLDEVVVTGSAYVDCDLCHGSVLKTDLDFHKEYVCPERKITCPICHVSYKDYQGHNCNGVCARCGKSKEQCTCSTDIVDNNSNDGSGGIGENSGSGGGGGSSVIGNPGYNKYGQTFTYDDLKWKNISTINNMPPNPPQQIFPNECVVDAAALMASIETGKDYNDMRFDLLNYCLCMGKDVRGPNALSLQDIVDVLYLAIDVKQENFNTSSIENSLNNNHPVLALVSTGEYTDYISSPEYSTELLHMVTIVGYDSFYYYCAIGEKNKYTAISKSNFKKNYIFRIK